jgi:hypothetical protein
LNNPEDRVSLNTLYERILSLEIEIGLWKEICNQRKELNIEYRDLINRLKLEKKE